MREIKFKYYLKEKSSGIINEIVVLHLEDLVRPYNLINVISTRSSLSAFSIQRKYDIIGPYEYTGLKDRNGTEIYEGDLVRLFNHVYRVVWSTDDCRFEKRLFGRYKQGRKIIERLPARHYELHIEENLEIIGNIHETRELLN